MAAAVHPMISIVIFTWRSPPAWWPYSEPTVGGWGGERRALRRAGRGRSAERAAVGNLALGDCENDGAVFAGESRHENLRLEARHAFRAQAGRTHHLTPDELIRLVERGELCARLSDPERSEVYPELVGRLAGFGKRFHSPDRPDAYSNTLEIAPGRNARGFSGHAVLAGPGSQKVTVTVPYTKRPSGEKVATSALLSTKARGASGGRRFVRLLTPSANVRILASLAWLRCQSYASRRSHVE